MIRDTNYASSSGEYLPSFIKRENENQFTRDYHYKAKKSGNSKKIPSYAAINTPETEPTTDAEFLRMQQKKKLLDQESSSGQGKASQVTAKYPPLDQKNEEEHKPLPINDIRKSDKYTEKPRPPVKKIQKKEPLTPKPPRPTVSFAVAPQHPKEAFRPPTPVPFMHRVNSLPYVGVPEDDSTFFNEVQPSNINDSFDLHINEPSFEDSMFFTAGTNTSRPCTPVERNTPTPLFLPSLELLDPTPTQFYSSEGSSRQISPSLRERSPSLPLFIPEIPWYRRWKKEIVVFVIVCVLLFLFMF